MTSTIRTIALWLALGAALAAQNTAQPHTTPFIPQPILPGGQILPLFLPGSPFLHADRVAEPEQNNMQRWVPGRIQSIVNIHNLEMHIYGNGVHGNGLKDRGGAPFGTWQLRFIDWFRDLGFLGKPGVETKAACDVSAHVTPPASR